jgi:uncharacterized protein (DUF58 family)
MSAVHASSGGTSAALFDAAFLAKLEHLRLVSTRACAGYGRGDRLGRNRGRGLEFADYRPYAQGDDFRHIDWKAYKRLDRLLLRLFDEEQDLSVHLLLDASRSMAEHGAFDLARRIAAALCYIGLAHLDRVALIPFDERLGADASIGRTKPSIARVFESLERLRPVGRTDLWQMATEFGRRTPRAGMAVVISDFLDPAGYERALRLLASMGHDVFAIHTTSRVDAAALAGDVCLVDAETGDRRVLDVTPALAEAYGRACDAHAADLAACCARCRAGYLRAMVEEPFEQTILHTFRTGRFLE